MLKGKAVRIGGFVAALTGSAALIASATGATGAYFNDSHNGSISAASGHLKLNVSNTTLDFANLVPGKYQTLDINYSTDTNVNEDIWLVFDPTSDGYQQFTGPKNNAFGGGLGRYGHFAVANNDSTEFTSYNLQNEPTGGNDPVCPVDANGDGGSNQQATSKSDTPPLCGVPAAIKLASNVANGVSGQIEVTFGVTGRWTAQNTPVANVPFKIVATQTGVRPDADNF